MLIKSRNFSLDRKKMESTFDESPDGLGWGPGYEKKFEGLKKERNSIRYGKNYSLMMGVCKKCDKFTDQRDSNGGHCSLPINKACQI